MTGADSLALSAAEEPEFMVQMSRIYALIGPLVAEALEDGLPPRAAAAGLASIAGMMAQRANLEATALVGLSEWIETGHSAASRAEVMNATRQ